MKNKIIIVVLGITVVALSGYIVADKFVIKKTEDNKTIINQTYEMKNKVNKEENTILNNKIDENKDYSFSGKIKLTSEEKIIKKLEVKNASYVCKEFEPIISGIDDDIAKKIEKKLKLNNEKKWDEINSKNSDETLNEMLSAMGESNEKREIGFSQKYTTLYENDRIVTFYHEFDGGLGGVSWYESYGISFDLTTGEEVRIKNIVTDTEKYIDACKESVYKQIENDDRKNLLDEDYKKIVDENIEKMEGWLTKDGIVCTNIQRYEMAAGAAGEFQFEVPYENIKNYIKAEFVF